jgi:hypothetical protein
VTATSEQALWVSKIKKAFPGAERIENTVKLGTPDICYPTHHGWAWLELKIRMGRFIYLRKFQLAFMVRTMRLSTIHWPHYLVWDNNHDLCQVLDAQQMFNLPRRIYSDEKIQAEINFDIEWVTLEKAAKQLDAYSGRG